MSDSDGVKAPGKLVPSGGGGINSRSGGGGPGLPGKNLINGEEVAGKLTVSLQAGDLVTVETPGGGGYGRR